MTEQQTMETQAVEITFFEDRAEVVRRATCSVSAGMTTLTLSGVSVFIDDPSLVVRVQGEGARALGSRILRTVRDLPGATPSEIEQMDRDHRAAERKRKAVEQAVDRARRGTSRSLTLMQGWTEAIQRVPQGCRDAADEWSGSFERMDEQLQRSLRDAAEQQRVLQLATADETRARLRLELGRRVDPDYRTTVEVQIEAKHDARVEIELEYRVPCALWRPEHVAHLVSLPNGAHELQIKTLATVWQATGERWDGVRCKFSTARPARSASPPLLSEDLLRTRRKTDTERRVVHVEERDEVVANVGLDRGTRKVDEMPGVDDGGEPVSYEASQPCTIASDGHPFRVELHERQLGCELDRVGYPERSEAVHFRATATLSGDRPLLAGPLWIARGSAIVGRSKTDFVGQGESFELGMGVDDGLRVRRTIEEKRDVTPVIGTQKIKRKVGLFVSNLSGTQRTVHLVERFPISEIEDVEVEVTSHREGRVDARDGFVHYELTIPGQDTKQLELEYRIEAGSKVVI